MLWGTLLGYIIQAVWLLALANRADGVRARPRIGLESPYWTGIMAAAGVMLVGQVAMSFVGPIDQYTAANLGANANATIGYATRLLSLLLGWAPPPWVGRPCRCLPISKAAETLCMRAIPH